MDIRTAKGQRSDLLIVILKTSAVTADVDVTNWQSLQPS